jgi:hypothetical protein
MTKLFQLRKNSATALLLLLFAATAISASAQRTVTVPAGTRLVVRIVDNISGGNSRAGTLFTARLQGNLMVGNTIAAPDGSTVFGRVIASRGAGRGAGRSELSLELTDIQVNGTRFPILSNDYSVQGSNALGGTASRTARGAGLGAVIGAIGGNAGRGAAIGAVTGGGASMIARGEQINIPSGTLLEFRLQQPASLPGR